MADKDLRPEQMKLLRFEKLIEKTCREKVGGKGLNKAAVLAGLPLIAAASAGAAQKLGDDAPLRYAADVEAAARSSLTGDAWLIQLAEAVSTGHTVIEALATQGSWLFVHGTPKRKTAELVQSLLTSGPF